MLDSYMAVLAEHQIEKRAQQELDVEMRQLPDELLAQAASGQFKFAECRGVDWLRQFEGTPLLDVALQLEQQDIQLEALRQQFDEQQNQELSQLRTINQQRQQVELRRKLLELQMFAQRQKGAPADAASPPVEVPPPPPGPAEAPPPPEMQGVAKQASDSYTTVQFRDVQRHNEATLMGRKLAHQEVANLRMTAFATEVGEELAKHALDVGGIAKNLAPMARQAAGSAVGTAGKFLSANPGAMAGAAIGGLGGAASGLQKDEHGQRHVLRGLTQGAAGAALGAGVGYGAQKGVAALKGRLPATAPSVSAPASRALPGPSPTAPRPSPHAPPPAGGYSGTGQRPSLRDTPRHQEWLAQQAAKAPPTAPANPIAATQAMRPPTPPPRGGAPMGRIDTNAMMGQPPATAMSSTIPGAPVMSQLPRRPPPVPQGGAPMGRINTSAMMGG